CLYSAAYAPLGRRDPVQLPAFVAAQADDSNRSRTLVLGGASPATVSYALVRGPGARLGDAELLAEAGAEPRLAKVVSSLVSGSGADQSAQLGGFAIRYIVLPPDGPRQFRQVLDATPGLKSNRQDDGTAVWEVERALARAVIVPGKQGQAPIPVEAEPVEAHTKIPAGDEGRTLRIADRAAPGWRATLDGKPLKPRTLDGWAQGFELPATGGRLDLAYQDSLARDAWHWAQGLLALLLLVLALPGRRARLDDDLPEEAAAVPEQSGPGEGRRARRLRAGAEAEAEAPAAAEAAVAADPYAQIPAQPAYGHQGYAEQGYAEGYGGQGHPEQQYGDAAAGEGTYAYQAYPYEQQRQQPYPEPYPYPQQPYDPYRQQQPQQEPPYTYGQHDPRPDGSPQQ
ncbi:family 2 glycosyl transferase, partial [Streptomyces sp. NPDC054838]